MNHRSIVGGLVAALIALGACGSDDSATDATTTSTVAESTTTTTAPAVEPLVVLVTNDDGIGATGIDVLVNALLEVDDLEVVVVAPAANQSGSSDKTTPGGASYAAGSTASGVEGTAVDGFPADTIGVALDELGLAPDLVVSGINEGQNTGPLAYASGTVGAARTAARRGIPAVAGSAGLGEDAEYAAAAERVVAWIGSHRDDLMGGTVPVDTITSINVPTCTIGSIRDGSIEVPLAAAFPDGVDPFTSDCTIENVAPPADDVAAVASGYAAETLVPIDSP